MFHRGPAGAKAARRRNGRGGAVSIIFATAVFPLMLCVGLAIDYGFYVQALAQSTMAADAAAIHAVRVAVTNYNAGTPAAVDDLYGATAGQQWFQAQLGSLVTGTATLTALNPVTVTFVQSTGTFTAVVNYQLSVPTHFGGLVKIPVWKTNQVSTAAVTVNAFVEVDMVLDTSASMSIGTTPDDMLKIEEVSVCMPNTIATRLLSSGAEADVFEWNYTGALGYLAGQQTPTPTVSNGKCNLAYTSLTDADQRLCQSVPLIISTAATYGTQFQIGAQDVNKYGYCPTADGVQAQPTKTAPAPTDPLNKNNIAMLPLATCSLACHDDPAGGHADLDGLIRALNSSFPDGDPRRISIRLDVVLAAAAAVIGDLSAKEQQLGLPNQFSVGVYEINSTYGQQDYPLPGGPFVEAGTDLNTAKTITANLQPTNNSTDIDDGLKSFASVATPSGSGGSAATPRKNIFLVTDGLQDTLRGGGVPAGPRWKTITPANCTTLKSMGFNIFVLYTPFYALPHYQFLTVTGDGNPISQLSEPLANSAITAALTACATTPQQFFQASSATAINAAMTQMLNLALNQPATITK